jgi:peptidoglycan/xylan/chitin deacetylase (PgdA/CDA1 family)
MKNINQTIFLTFDVEEFDLPLEFNKQIDHSEQMDVGKKGVDIIASILKEHDITATLFTTGSFAKMYPEVIKNLSNQHEIASHSLFHSTFEKSDLLNSKKILKDITGQEIEGFRMPRMKKINIDWIKEAGYNYDSSIHPIYMPGRYNNLHLPRKFYIENDLPRLPCSVSPNLRIPLFWLSFKNFPYRIYMKLAIQTLKNDGYLVLYFHPWEFTDISKYKLPFYIKQHSGDLLQQNLSRLVKDLKSFASFNTIGSIIKKWK